VGTYFLDGAIDEIKIWNIVKTEQEVSNSVSTILTGNEAGLVGYYKFEEGSGQDVLDSSSKGNHGYLGASTAAGSDDPTRIGSVVPVSYTVGGEILGLDGSVTLQNGQTNDLVRDSNGSFTFSSYLMDGIAYHVEVSVQPAGQVCSVTNGSGFISSANVTNVEVICVTNGVPVYSVGGTVSGLTGAGLALQNNGVDTLTIAADGGFTFLTKLTDSSAFMVTVSTQPSGQTCNVTNGGGTIAAADISDVGVNCTDDVPIAPPSPTVPIPSMSEWALLLLTMLLGLMVFANRKRLF